MGTRSWLDRVFRGEAVSDAEYGARETAAGGLYEAAEEPADAMEVFARHAAAGKRSADRTDTDTRRDNLVEFSRAKPAAKEASRRPAREYASAGAGELGGGASGSAAAGGSAASGISGGSGGGFDGFGEGFGVSRAAGESADAYVVFKRLKDFTTASHVADRMTESKIVILNLESCDDEIARRVLDFIGGVAYACGSMVKRIAGRVFMITPKGVSSDGEFFDEARESTAIRYDD